MPVWLWYVNLSKLFHMTLWLHASSSANKITSCATCTEFWELEPAEETQSQTRGTNEELEKGRIDVSGGPSYIIEDLKIPPQMEKLTVRYDKRPEFKKVSENSQGIQKIYVRCAAKVGGQYRDASDMCDSHRLRSLWERWRSDLFVKLFVNIL